MVDKELFQALNEVWPHFYMDLTSRIERIKKSQKMVAESLSTPKEVQMFRIFQKRVTEKFRYIVDLIKKCELNAPQPLEVFAKGGSKRIVYEKTLKSIEDIRPTLIFAYKNLKSPYLEEYIKSILAFCLGCEKN